MQEKSDVNAMRGLLLESAEGEDPGFEIATASGSNVML